MVRSEGMTQPWPPYANAKNAGYLPTEDERDKAFWAHIFGAIADFLFASFLVPIAAPLIAMAMAKDKGPFLMFHVNQSFWFRVVISATQIAIFILGFPTCGFAWFLLPIPPLVGVVYSLIVGLAARNGEWREHVVIGEKVLNSPSPVFK